jgi:hypothetical protein
MSVKTPGVRNVANDVTSSSHVIQARPYRFQSIVPASQPLNSCLEVSRWSFCAPILAVSRYMPTRRGAR